MNPHLSSVESFYDNKCILITGFTGFIGKVCVEKLLRSTNVKKIYVLVRSKNGTNSDQRVKDVLRSPPFSFFSKTQESIGKVVTVAGDITNSNLGLNDNDLNVLIKEVSIVIHAAATIRFTTNMKNSLKENVLGTQNLLKVCDSLENLESLVYVSTAYSSCQQSHVQEKVHILKVNTHALIQLNSYLDDQEMDVIFSVINEGRPSPYNLTKAMAESLVEEKKGSLTVSIVRPSIVCNSMSEPSPGWIDNLNGMSGVTIAATIGMIQVYDYDYYSIVDLFPVDYIANSLIVIAAYSATTAKNECKVYNLTSGSLNPITYGQFFDKFRNEIIQKPSIKTLRALGSVSKQRKAPFYHPLQVFVSHILFAYIFDFCLSIIGQKKFLVKATNKLISAIKVLDYYAHRTWAFDNHNYIQVLESLNQSDQEKFQFDIRKLEWNKFIANYYEGNRKFIFKEDDSNLQQAKRRFKVIHIIFSLFSLIQIGLVLATLYYIISYSYGKLVGF